MHIVIYGIIVLFEVIFYRQADLFWNTVFLWKIQWNNRERESCNVYFYPRTTWKGLPLPLRMGSREVKIGWVAVCPLQQILQVKIFLANF